ncbi:YciI family protein [Nonomuraea rhizosphaerae]|uniref:YciI family protein n=1 Tax=Nonomuraea rhizosphaerae TaxID=2665663 RepID=UPI001FEBF67D|nr:YciI family protein [Nonomuraea rhizosphaerae]
MKNYLLSVYQPDGELPAEQLEPIVRELAAWSDDLRAAGGWVFSAGLHPPHTATVVRERDGRPIITDGPYTEGKEHIGGFTVIRAADLDAALAWAGRLAEITTLAIEVRPLQDG